MPQPVVHFEISAKDRAKITDFYSQLFGWQVNADNPMNYGLASTKDGELGIDGGIYQQQDENDTPGSESTPRWMTWPLTWPKPKSWGEPRSKRPWKFQEWGS